MSLSQRISSAYKDFFDTPSHPLNLAVFRIVLFLMLYHWTDTEKVVWYSHIPAELVVAPFSMHWAVPYLTTIGSFAKPLAWFFKIFCLMGIVGFFSRTAAFLVTVLGIYTIGLPQFYGKVDHYHHLLWFSAILSVSPCADFFSLDAVIASWKRADQGLVGTSGPSSKYTVPIRFIWLFIGVIYFFPGLWKFLAGGREWVFGENFKFQLYTRWLDLGGYIPALRIDQYPWLYKFLALGSILFELTFIFLIFFAGTRMIAIVAGLLFHNMTRLLMKIPFWHLQQCYVVFFDWHEIFRRIGSFLFKQEMVVAYDGNCELCRRTIASLNVFDIFDRIVYVNVLEPDSLTSGRLDNLSMNDLLKDMHAMVGRKTWKGYQAYRVIATRVPILWPVLPFLYVWPVTLIGSRIYRHVADSRA